MKVLSLFDGMSCGQIALQELGIVPEKYYASEIDKFAIQQTQLNFPNTIQLGDVEKWKEWDIEWDKVDLLLAGSPCQGFSFAGKGLAFDDPRSKLFFVFVDILNHIRELNPNVKFLLENVNMKREHREVISQYCGVQPVRINSNLVSAQNRDRFYWTNIRTKEVGIFNELHSDIPQPEDRKIFLKDVLEDEVDEKYYIGIKQETYIKKEFRLNKKFTQINGSKSLTLCAKSVTNWCGDYIIQLPRGKNKGGIHKDKTPTLSSNAWEQNNMVIQLNPSTESGGKQPYQQNRIYDIRGKCPALQAQLSTGSNNISVIGNLYPKHDSQSGRIYATTGKGTTIRGEGGGCGGKTGLYHTGERIRRLTPTECARLQTIPEWYKWECSETQQYRMLGNGWTIEVIKHILSFLN